MIYLIGDTHFYHNNIIEYCNRPFKSSLEMNDIIIENWNSIITEDDTVIHLGDFAIGYDRENYNNKKDCYIDLMRKLNGEKILVRGNHDHESVSFYKDIGFEEVYDYFVYEDILFFHYPLKIDKYTKKEQKEMIERVKKEQFNYVIHGHIHNNSETLKNHFNCSIENINYKPIEFEEIKRNFIISS